MKRAATIAGVLLLASSTLALAAPESLLPPGFDDPPPAAQPQAPSRPAQGARPQVPAGQSSPVVQPLPGAVDPGPGIPEQGFAIPEDFPSLAEIEQMEPDEIDELFGLKPKFDVPPGARRAVSRVGVISSAEGGFPSGSLVGQPARLVSAILRGTRGPMVSRWGHILMRRALASRLDAPRGMDPVAFAALRAAVLNRMGEAQVARSLVQDVDSANYNPALTNAAFDAYLTTGDLLGMCAVARLKSDVRDDGEWNLLRSICLAYSGQARRAERELDRAMATGAGGVKRIDVLLARRYAGAAGDGRRAVNIEWNDVEELTPWRFALARSLGVDIPDDLRADAGARYDIGEVVNPAVALPARVAASEFAASRGILSSAAMIDMYAQVWTAGQIDEDLREQASDLREAYLAVDPGDRLEAMQRLWGADASYGRQVLTAYAAARLPAEAGVASDPSPVISSMLAAGLDRNAVRWQGLVEEGSLAWGLLALARPGMRGTVDAGAVDSFVDDDSSPDKRKSRFLVAGLAGLGRLDSDDANGIAQQLGVQLNRETRWSRAITRAGNYRNQALVAMLAGLGMQGDSWERMTARHLFHIVRALRASGLEAEARMIAAEAVARG